MARLKYYWFPLFLLFLFGLSYYSHEEDIDWRETYSPEDRIPYGTFLLFNQLPRLFPEDEITRNERPFSEWLGSEDVGKNLIIISNDMEFGEIDQELILEFAGKGNQVFIANESLTDKLLEDLNLTDKILFTWNPDTSTLFRLVNPAYRNEQVRFTNLQASGTLIPGDDFEGRILGISGDDSLVNFIQIPYHNGNVYLHLAPKVFANIHFLENPQYIARCLSYLPRQETIWDDYYKPYFRSEEKGAFQLIKKNQALNYAWTLLITGTILALFFFAKRRQRAIPLIPQPENNSLEFIETIGDLYFQEGNHLDVAKKKIRYFYHNVQLLFLLHEHETDFWIKLRQKSGAKETTIHKLKEMIQAIDTFKQISPAFLGRLNNHLEDFYAQTGKYPYHE
ncbi:MAG: DUF4350 domain-containing protein [Bacteroidia bacterium]